MADGRDIIRALRVYWWACLAGWLISGGIAWLR